MRKIFKGIDIEHMTGFIKKNATIHSFVICINEVAVAQKSAGKHGRYILNIEYHDMLQKAFQKVI